MTQALAETDLALSPYWWEAAPLDAPSAARLPAETDVAVVGAGYAGLAAALTLVRAGRSVVVLDAMAPGEGASRRNGGICSGNVQRGFRNLIERVGLEAAKAIYAEGIAARRHLAELIAEEAIDCGFALAGRFSGASRAGDYEPLGREADLLNTHFDLGVEMVGRADQHRELGTDFYFGGQVRSDIGGLHPGLFHAGLQERAVAAGAMVAGHTPVLSIQRDGVAFAVTTGRGGLRAGDVIVATNGYTGAATPWLRRRVIPIQSQIIATEALAPGVMDRLMPKRRMLGDTRYLYNYYRPSPDGACIIFGGRAGSNQADPRRSGRHLYGNLIAIFPELDGVRLTHSWSGFTGYTFDLLPHLTVHDGIHYATGFCGSGVVWAPWLGHKAALRVLGARGADSRFEGYPLRTRPLYYGAPWFIPPLVVWYGIRDRLGF
jgi:glycine/D-amino acid oxidase-like deaminating enzyme